jgi:hypothetical protein
MGGGVGALEYSNIIAQPFLIFNRQNAQITGKKFVDFAY